VKAVDPLAPVPSVTVTSTALTETAVVVPETTPVRGSMRSPAGSPTAE